MDRRTQLLLSGAAVVVFVMIVAGFPQRRGGGRSLNGARPAPSISTD
jgi:hypothetical protein